MNMKVHSFSPFIELELRLKALGQASCDSFYDKAAQS
jgi:hypothetical protein